MLKRLLQGRPLKHPLHPLLIHFPIGLFLLNMVLDWLTWIGPDSAMLATGAFASIGLGLLTAAIAAVPGFADYSDIRRDHPAKRTATAHMLLNLWAVTLYAVNFAVRWEQGVLSPTPPLPLALSVMGMAIIGASGWLGGTMVYDDGIAVGRHRRATPLPRDTVRVSGEGDAEGYLDVVAASEFGEHETLRAEVNGHVMTIARVGGELFAFQEFCTHRFGPLSEGTFHDGQVMCPWHRSCFDVRTGAVTAGPAEVPLKIFDVRVRNGRILARAQAGRPKSA